jgi:3-deoxy-D-manno-octulosonic-acid transferase
MTPSWYRAAWALARPLALVVARGESALARAVRGHLAATAAIEAWAAAHRDPARPLVWLHAASVGEGRQAEAVLQRLRAARPAWQYLYTFTSASAERLAASLPVDFAGYAPPDTAGETGRALDAARPSLLAFAANDVWPELMRQAVRRRVRTALVSANLSAGSSRRGRFAAALLGPAYAALDVVGAIDAADAAQLVWLGVRRECVRVTGDSRHDAAAARAAAVDRTSSHRRALAGDGTDRRPIVVAGSTWPSDETRLLPALGALRRGGLAFRLVVAPHEPTAGHLRDLEAAVRAALGASAPGGPGRAPDAAVTTLSALEDRARGRSGAAPSWDVCLVDRVGILAELYAGAAFAYVGGGFHRQGLHAVIEPAALGVPVFFGPRWRASRDARLLLDAGGAVTAPDQAALERAARDWLANDTARATAGAAARAVVERGLGAAERSVGLLLDLLEPPAIQPTV